jgi:undecaprenyl phosphate-alpha-L-ara4FN deformylase
MALKIDVDTYRGTREGAVRLRRLLDDLGIRASFFFTLGPDHTGRRIFRALRPEFLRKVRRTSVVSNYGVRTLLYGVLLPGPMIGRRCREELRVFADDGHEVGLHVYDHALWQDHARARGECWTRRQLEKGIAAFQDVWGCRPTAHAAAGWQINESALMLEESLGFRYASDCRGEGGPFYPSWNGRVFRCPQVPTTLPTLDEVLGRDGVDADNFPAFFERRVRECPGDHVLTLHAELEGGRYLEGFARLLRRWLDQGIVFETLQERLARHRPDDLPVRPLVWAAIPGRAGDLVVAA